MSALCRFFGKQSANDGESISEDLSRADTVATDTSAFAGGSRAKFEDGFVSLTNEAGVPIRDQGFSGGRTRGQLMSETESQLKNDPDYKRISRGLKSESNPFSIGSGADREEFSMNDPTGQYKRNLLRISRETDERVGRGMVNTSFPEGSTTTFVKPTPLPDIEELKATARSEPSNPRTIPEEFKTKAYQSNKEVISDAGKNLGDQVRGSVGDEIKLEVRRRNQLRNEAVNEKYNDLDDVGKRRVQKTLSNNPSYNSDVDKLNTTLDEAKADMKTRTTVSDTQLDSDSPVPKVKPNKQDLKGGVMTEEDLDENSIGDIAGKVVGRVVGLAGLALSAEQTIAGKGSTKQKATALTEQTGSQVAQEGGDELIKRANLTQRILAPQQTTPAMGDSGEPKFSDSSNAFSEGGASAENNGFTPPKKSPSTPSTGGGDADPDVDPEVDAKLVTAGTDAVDTDLALGGPEDVVGDVISGIVGVGTLLGGIFGDESKPKAPAPVQQPNLQTAIQIGVDN